tara:strand:- start:2189 stop:2911 length:723 start_codon:yes stop_codon:yes gene_type:complete
MNVALIGYGKMGKTLERLLKEKNHTVVGIVDFENSNRIEENLEEADVAIEFSTPKTAYNNIAVCIRNNVPVVSGTTGWLDQIDDIKKLVTEHEGAFFYASNYSIGVNIFFEVNRYLAQLMNQFPQYDVLMEEVHHTEKKDSPSGTAITIAEGILSNIDKKSNWKENAIPKSDTLPIYAKRIGKVFGDHEVQYHNEVDTLKISHKAFGREGFAHGAISAAEWLLDKKGVFGMNDMLGLSEK